MMGRLGKILLRVQGEDEGTERRSDRGERRAENIAIPKTP
jgi:hypothetical protein